MRVFRIAVIGAGLIGREHCKLVAAHRLTELVGIADNAPAARRMASGFPAAFYTDYRKMLDELRPDAAIVALPNHLHLSAGLFCLSRGIPCLIEKPIADNLDDARALAEASEAANVPVLIGHHRRFSPDMERGRDIVRGGDLGDIVTVNGSWLADKPDAYFEASWRTMPGGGPVLINLIHEIDCLRYIVGEFEKVHAFTSNAIRNFEVEDTVCLNIGFESGVLGSFILSDAVASPYNWEMTSGQALYFPYQPGDCFIVGGRKASLALPSMTIWSHKDPGGHWQTPLTCRRAALDDTRAYESQLSHFVECLTGICAPRIGPRDAMKTLAVTMAVAKSAAENRTVFLSEFSHLTGESEPDKASSTLSGAA